MKSFGVKKETTRKIDGENVTGNVGNVYDGSIGGPLLPTSNLSDPSTRGQDRELMMDGLSALLVPQMFGIEVPKEIRVREDDEKTMVEEYQAYR